ncbi:MAG TPA: tetratricopeptide repeat protein [Phycisphaerae bacterium]|nr:tetratricopeptide repeat protein [Phycisphaerae bacterium]
MGQNSAETHQEPYGSAEQAREPSRPRTASPPEWAGVIVLLVVAAYVPALTAGFAITDDRAIVANPRLTESDGLWRIWFSGESEQYQPLTYTTFWLERRLWGLRSAGYHWVNVALHAANAVLVWLILRKVGVRAAPVAALLFALHPINVESVAWIYERKNVLSGLFYLSTFLALFRFDQTRSRRWYALAIALFVAALLSKASTVVLPAVLLLYWWWRRDAWVRKSLIASAPFLLLAAAMCVLTVWLEPPYAQDPSAEHSGAFLERFARAGWIVGFYIWKTLLPYKLVFFYPRWSVDPAIVTSYLPHVVLAVALAGAVVWRRSWGRHALFGLGSYLITLLPILGFFNIFYHQHSFVADHFQYLPLISLIAMCVHAAAMGLERLRPSARHATVTRAVTPAVVLAVLTVATCWSLTWQRAYVFHNTRTICQDTLRHNPDSWIAHALLGADLLRSKQSSREQLTQALHHFERAATLHPDDPRILQNQGLTLKTLGRYSDSLRCFSRAAELEPSNARHHLNLAALYHHTRDFERAIKEYKLTLQCGGDQSATIHFLLAKALIDSGRTEDAIDHLRQAAQLNPRDPRPATLLEQLQKQHPQKSDAEVPQAESISIAP